MLLPYMLPPLQQLLQQLLLPLRPYADAVLLGVLLWSGIYLVSLLLSTVSLLCRHFNISCFAVGKSSSRHKQQ